MDGGAVATHVDGVQNGQSAADTEGKAEEEADEGAGVEAHRFHDGMRRAERLPVLVRMT